MAAAPPQQIDLADLDLQQLADVRRQLEEASPPKISIPITLTHAFHLAQELSHLTNSFTQLRQAQAKFRACIENVAEVQPQNKGAPRPADASMPCLTSDAGKTILVPLTNSLYVPGKLCDTDHVVVDVGTGYYVKKTRTQATKHYESKVDYIRANLETLQDTLQKKQDNLNVLVNVMQSKLQAEAAKA
ncbi:hypothetical protein EIP86_008193 [Pleurotus ostreatoroseus]|nr:hypothetical protein EIP86_008193 [Pleurotus ostreatoroseus]